MNNKQNSTNKLNGVPTDFGIQYRLSGWHWFEDDEVAARVDAALKLQGHIYYHVVECRNKEMLGWRGDFNEYPEEPTFAETPKAAEQEYNERKELQRKDIDRCDNEIAEKLENASIFRLSGIVKRVLGENCKILDSWGAETYLYFNEAIDTLRYRGIFINGTFIPLRSITRVTNDDCILTIDNDNYRLKPYQAKAVRFALSILG